jgi:hypothetical protein
VSFVRFILGSRARLNKPHIGWRPKWFAIQIGALPNWSLSPRRVASRQFDALTAFSAE